MQNFTLKYEKRPYIVFTVIFGILLLLGLFAEYSTKKSISVGAGYLIPLGMYLTILVILRVNKVRYDDNQIKHRNFFGIKIINIQDITKYEIKSTIEPFKPTLGFYIDTKQKKSDIVIPANLFTVESLNNLMKHIDGINGKPHGKINAGKSIFKY